MRPCPTCMRFVILVLLLHAVVAGQEQWLVKRIDFSGNYAYSAGQLRGVMQTTPTHFWKKSVFSRPKLEADLSMIDALYRQKGYLAEKSSIASVNRDTLHHRVAILITINEGPQTLVDSVAIEGVSVLNDSAELTRLSTKVNAPFNRVGIDNDGARIVTDLGKRGYLYAHVDDSTQVDSVQLRAEANFRIDQGPLVLAGYTNVKGLKNVKEAVVTRELRYKPGDTLTTEKTDLTIQRLYATGLFNFLQVKVPPENLTPEERDQDTVTQPVYITADEARFFSVDASAGYGTYDYFRGTLELRYANFWGLGHSGAFDGLYNRFQLRGAFTYAWPWILSLPLTATASVYIERHDVTYRGLFDGILFAVSHQTDWYFSYRLWADFERIEYITAIQDTTAANSEPHTQAVGTDLYYDTRSRLTDSTHGAFIQFSPELAGLGGRGSNQYYRLFFDIRGFITPLWNAQLSGGVQIGYTRGYGHMGTNVPPQAFFNIGIEGLRPVRGYPQNEPSPGGGRMALVLNLFALQHQVYSIFGLAFWTDAGYAWSNPEDFSLGSLRWTIGPGIYAKTPVGQIELDWGYRLNPLAEWGSVYLSIGQAF